MRNRLHALSKPELLHGDRNVIDSGEDIGIEYVFCKQAYDHDLIGIECLGEVVVDSKTGVFVQKPLLDRVIETDPGNRDGRDKGNRDQQDKYDPSTSK